VKDLLRQARDLVKFITNIPSASSKIENEVSNIFQEAEQAYKGSFFIQMEVRSKNRVSLTSVIV
jgi:hypothetical protein